MAYYRQWVQGEQVSYSDLLDLQDRTRYLATQGAGSILRAASWCQYNPASITLSVDSTGHNVLFGGPSTNFFINYRYCDYVPQQSFPVSSNAGGSGQRNDIIAAIPADVQGSAFQRGVKIGNTVTVTTCYTQYDGIETEYIVGTPGEGDPAVPGGYVPLVRVVVPAGASTISASDLIVILPTASDIIAEEIGGGVTSLNSLMGALQLVSRTPQFIAIDTNNGQLGLTFETNDLVTSVNGLTGNVPITGTGGISVEVESGEIVISNTESFPVGTSRVQVTRIPSLTATSVALPSALTAGTWRVIAYASVGILNGNMAIALTGCSINTEGSITNGATSQFQYVDITGEAESGDTPQATVTFNNSGGMSREGTPGLLVITATRVS